MGTKYDETKNRLRSILEFYFRRDIPKWDNDYSAEVQQIVLEIEEMIDEKIKECLKDGYNKSK